AALGDVLGVSFQQIQKYENGSNAIASTNILKLAKALELTVGQLLGEDADAAKHYANAMPQLSTPTLRIALAGAAMKPHHRKVVVAVVRTLTNGASEEP